jgi:hypothetical protein
MTAHLPPVLRWALLTALLGGLLLVPAASAAGELVAEPQEVSFGTLTAGEQRSLPLSVRNVGLDSVTLTEAWLLYEDGTTVEPFSVDAGSCATVEVLDAGAACEMTATFKALRQSGDFKALVVVEGVGVEPAVARLSGQAVPPPAVMLVAEPSRIDFPGTRIDSVSEPRQVRVRNTGNGTVAVPAAVIENPHFGIVSNDCPAQLVPGASCAVGVVFKPTDGLPRPIGYAVGEGRHGGALAFGPRNPVTRRHPLAVALAGAPAPRLTPEQLIEGRLTSLVASIPRALRGGPRHARLTVFDAPLIGMLALRVYAGPSDRRVLVAKGRKRFTQGERHRLRVTVTRKGRKLLRGTRRTRIRVALRYIAPDSTLWERTPRLLVKPPKAKRKQSASGY